MSDVDEQPTYKPGVSVTFWASDLQLKGVPITEGATVTFVLVDRDGDVEVGGGGSGTASNDDWYIDVDTPETPGIYRMLTTVVYEGKTFKGDLTFVVEPH